MEKALSAFLSHSNLDEREVRIIQHFLGEIGITPWVSYDNIHNIDFNRRIAQAIRENDIFLLILSNSSANSKAVQKECSLAETYNKTFIIYELERTDFPDELVLMLSGIQKIESFKFSDSFERLARIIINEKRLKWANYSAKAEDAASRIRHEQSELKEQQRHNLSIYKERYWEERTKRGIYRTHDAIAKIDNEILEDLRKRLNISEALASKVHADFNNRKKSIFTKLLNSTLAHKELTVSQLMALERKRVSECVSQNEIKSVIFSRKRLPSLAANDRSSVPQSDVGWIIKLLDQRNEQLNPTKTTTSSPNSEALSAVPMGADKSTEAAVNKHGQAGRKADGIERDSAVKKACRMEDERKSAVAKDVNRREDVGLVNQNDADSALEREGCLQLSEKESNSLGVLGDTSQAIQSLDETAAVHIPGKDVGRFGKTNSPSTLPSRLLSSCFIPNEAEPILAVQVINGERFTSIEISQIDIKNDELVILGKPVKDSGPFPKNRIPTPISSLRCVDIFPEGIRVNESRPKTYVFIKTEASTDSYAKLVEFFQILVLPTAYRATESLESYVNSTNALTKDNGTKANNMQNRGDITLRPDQSSLQTNGARERDSEDRDASREEDYRKTPVAKDVNRTRPVFNTSISRINIIDYKQIDPALDKISLLQGKSGCHRVTVKPTASDGNVVRMSSKHGVNCLDAGRPLLYVNDSLVRGRNGFVVFEKGILMASSLRSASFFFFGHLSQNSYVGFSSSLDVKPSDLGLSIKANGFCLLKRSLVNTEHSFCMSDTLKQHAFIDALQTILSVLQNTWSIHASELDEVKSEIRNLAIYKREGKVFDLWPTEQKGAKGHKRELIKCCSEMLECGCPCPSLADFLFSISNRRSYEKGGISIAFFSQTLVIAGDSCFDTRTTQRVRFIKYTELRQLIFRVSATNSCRVEMDIDSESFMNRAIIDFDDVISPKEGFVPFQLNELNAFIKRICCL